jgi:hypothetical protein
MDFSRLDANEKLATYGAIAGIIGAILGGQWLILILGVIMIIVVFLPQWSPQTTLPGSKGSLMLVVGGIAALGALLGLLALLAVIGAIAFYAGFLAVYLIGLVLSIIGGFVMGWAGWQEFQGEGGHFQLGTASSGTRTAPPADTTTPPTAPPPAATPRADTTSAPPDTTVPPTDTTMRDDETRG